MKPDLDKEMDSLLRRSPYAALWPEGGSVRASAVESKHMDADELNAYAENALPAGARARYTSHLADCDECRKIVINLAVTADAAGKLEKRAAVVPVATPHGSTWRAWLGALFAPGVMRYAVPLVALCIVGAITFIAVRTRRDESLATLQTRTNEDSREAISKGESPAASSTSATITQSPEQAAANSQTGNAAPSSSPASANANAPTAPAGVAGRVNTDAPPPPPSAGRASAEEKEVAELAKAQQEAKPAPAPTRAVVSRQQPP
ncbi:MAG: zf-HC2 domain-containing protein [Acidobacteria bacterium]|nr:zf-HC2 domain-containing protein [Acidobacteriota bacterium]